jgi:hypothetical protein
MSPATVDESRFGLFVEGIYDEGVFIELVQRIVPVREPPIVRVCRGVARLMKEFPALLRDLEFACAGRPVDKALVIRDWAGPDPLAMEARMRAILGSRSYCFPRGVEFCIVRHAIEAWLLADTDAINALAGERRGRSIPEQQGQLEEIDDPKEVLSRLLARARLPYDPKICREIARRANIETLRYRCPSFRAFEARLTSR